MVWAPVAMNRQRSSFAFAASVSLVVHAALCVVLWHIRLAMPAVVWRTPEREETPTVIPEDVQNEPTEAPLTRFEMGEETGTGYASHDAPAQNEATAREADTDQAYLSLDPQGAGGSGADASVAQMAGKGSTLGQIRGTPLPPIEEHGETPPETTAQMLAPLGPKSDLKAPRHEPKLPLDKAMIAQSSEPEVQHASQPTPAPTPSSTAVVAMSVAPAPAPTAPAVADAGSTVNGSQLPAADPARMSDSESDPFSRLGTAVFTDGEWRVQFGRKVKTRKPRLLLAGMDALISMNRAQVRLKIDVDATGKVTGVKVIKSSGSNDIDQPTRVSIYDWWFEPRKDAAGNPVPDQIEFCIGWR